MASASLLPPCAPFPPVQVVRQLPGAEWTSCIEAWEFLLEAYLSIPSADLANATKQHESLVSFLVAYAEAIANPHEAANLVQAGSRPKLRRFVFLSVHKLLLDVQSPAEALLRWQFLGDVSNLYRASPSLSGLLQAVWKQHESALEASLKSFKEDLVQSLESSKSAVVLQADFSNRLLPLAHALPPVAGFFIAGADLVDSLMASYSRLSEDSQQKIILLVYLGMTSLMQGEKLNASMLFDLIFTLRASLPPGTTQPLRSQNVLADLVTDTPLLSVMKKTLLTSPHATRAEITIRSLEPLQRPDSRQRRSKAAKGKAKQTLSFGHASSPVAVHDMAHISQIQDLFPDLGTAFIASLLTHFDNSVEAATAALLDDSLPAHLASLDRTANLSTSPPPPAQPTPQPALPARLNKYDNDAFDRLAVPASQLHKGKARSSATADSLLASVDDKTSAKAAILSALSAIDLDDDERDDTYDAEDVGGTVDAANPDAERDDANEEILFRAWGADASVFSREKRRTREREALKSETGMGDEVLEGWGSMLVRDPKRLRRLEGKYAVGGGGVIQQAELGRSSWREGEEGDDGASGRGRGRGRGGFRGRPRGSVAGANDERSTQVARQRKEASKGSRANHNRRDGRARKMARGGGLPG